MQEKAHPFAKIGYGYELNIRKNECGCELAK